MSIAANLDFLSRLPKMADFTGEMTSSPLQEMHAFGANPGHLSMWRYVPADLPANSPLVVVLHGCTQTAVSFDRGSGWTTLAARHGFAVLMPEQQRGNNPNLCFNWFDPDKTSRGGGEVLSIHRMIATMVRLHRVSASRIYIVGLSAGGAMASAMLAAYPEVFAGGAIIAGLPHGVAGNLREALSAMAAASEHSAFELGDRVRDASSHHGAWPKISVWHGTADRVVNPANADQVVAQWLDVHGLPRAPAQESTVDGQLRQEWRDAAGRTLVESYTVEGLGHGVPLAATDDKDSIGAAGPFMLEAGIASTRRIAEFFDLIATRHEEEAQSSPAHPFLGEAPRTKPADVIGVITRALIAAGLMK